MWPAAAVQTTQCLLSPVRKHSQFPKSHLRDPGGGTLPLSGLHLAAPNAPLSRNRKEERQSPRCLQSDRRHGEIQVTPDFFGDLFGTFALRVSPLCFLCTRFKDLSLLFCLLVQEQHMFTTDTHEKKKRPRLFRWYLGCVHGICISVLGTRAAVTWEPRLLLPRCPSS